MSKLAFETHDPGKRRSRWDAAPFQHELGVKKRITWITECSHEQVDPDILSLVSKIPYHSWGWAINRSKSLLLEWIKWANYSTLIAICQSLLNQEESYWNDNRDRAFIGLSEALTERLGELGYTVVVAKTISYIPSTWRSSQLLEVPLKTYKNI